MYSEVKRSECRAAVSVIKLVAGITTSPVPDLFRIAVPVGVGGVVVVAAAAAAVAGSNIGFDDCESHYCCGTLTRRWQCFVCCLACWAGKSDRHSHSTSIHLHARGPVPAAVAEYSVPLAVAPAAEEMVSCITLGQTHYIPVDTVGRY